MGVISICPRCRVYRKGSNGHHHIVFCIRSSGEERVFSTGLIGSRDDMLTACRMNVVRTIKIVYCIICDLRQSGHTFTLDDVVSVFRHLNRSGCNKFDNVIRNYGNDFPIDSSIAKISLPFRNDFKIIYDATDLSGISIMNYFSTRVSELRATGYLSTSRSYRSVMVSLGEFVGRDKRRTLRDIDAEFILGYEKFLVQRNLTTETIGFYMRTLRTALKTANERGLCLVNLKWFEAVNTSVGPRVRKMASKVLDINYLRKLQEIDLDGKLSLARDLFMFAFYCRGMELIDVLNLKSANVIGQYLIYNRRQKGVQQKVRLEPEAIKIIEKYHRQESVYLFPPLEGKGLPHFKTASNTIAAALKTIGVMLGCPHHLSFSYNRSTWQAIADEACLSSKLVG